MKGGHEEVYVWEAIGIDCSEIIREGEDEDEDEDEERKWRGRRKCVCQANATRERKSVNCANRECIY